MVLKKNEPAGYFFSLDFIKAVTIIAVIFFHATIPTFSQNVDNIIWYPTMIIRLLTSFTVPIFLMVSGFLMSTSVVKYRSFYQFYRKKIIRFFPWLLFFLLIFTLHENNSWSVFFSFFNVNDVWAGPFYHFYYIKVLLLFVLITPFLANFVDKSMQFSFVVLMSCFIVSQKVFFSSVVTPAFFSYVGYLLYFLLGMMARKYMPKKKPNFLLLGLCLLFLLVMNYSILVFEKEMLGLTKMGITYGLSYFSPLQILFNTLVFYFLFHCSFFISQESYLRIGVMFLASETYFIYLIHPLIQDLTENAIALFTTHIVFPGDFFLGFLVLVFSIISVLLKNMLFKYYFKTSE